MAGISSAGYLTPTPIQARTMPEILRSRDLIGIAQTGTGKTAAFVLPLIHRLLNGRQGRVRSLIIAPTRELAEQIHQAIEVLGSHTALRSVSIYGGVGIQPQVNALKKADIIVACPGRLLDHINRRTVDLSFVEILVLDEADQMFDMGFLPDIRKILGHLPQTDRQTLLFSATMPAPIRRLADDILKDPVSIQIGQEAPAETVSHAFFPVARHLKTELLLKLLSTTRTDGVLVFTRTKHLAKRLGLKLTQAGYRSTSLQGNLSQARRKNAMEGFRSGKYQVLVATDIAARGIDVSNISHVINYDMPSTSDIYIHRIGRTGRAKCRGQAFTLITDADAQMVGAINRAIGKAVEQRTFADFDYHVPISDTVRRHQRDRIPHRIPHPSQRAGSSRRKHRPSSEGCFAA